jgi:hypothetical protein
MRKSLKIISAVAAVFLILVVVAFVYAGEVNGLTNSNSQQTGNEYMQTVFGLDNVTLPSNFTWPCGIDRGPGGRMMGRVFNLATSMFENGTLSTVTGTVVSESGNLLILNTGSAQVQVMVPNEWTVGSEVVDRTSLFNGTFVASGQSLTVDVLMSDLFSNASYSVNLMLGYKAMNATGTQAYAVLPFNIVPSS